jgi:hypothetical protein
MSIILSWSRWLFRSFFWELIFCDDCGRNCWFCLIHSDINVIGSNWRIWIWFPCIFSSDSHFFVIESEFFEMSIILSWIRRVFFRPLLKLILLYNCWWNSRFCLIHSNINVISSDWGIRIWFPNILSSNRHIICIEPKFFKMSIILTRWRRLFFWPLRILIDFNDSWRYSWFSMTHSLIYIICANRRIGIWFPLIFSPDSHIICVVSEFLKMSIIFTWSI